MTTITISFDGDPYLSDLVRKVAAQGTAFERLKPGSTFTVMFDDQLVAVSMQDTPRPRLAPVTDRVPCGRQHAMALGDGIEVDCDLCR